MNYYEQHHDSYLEGLKTFLRIPSISTLSEHKPDIKRAAEFVRGELEQAGLQQAQLIEGEGNPLVYAEWLGAPGKPTVLFYGHYDVQPPDPLDEWKTPPFEPDIRNNNIYARGSADDKGQTYILIKAVEGLLKQHGKLPINVKFLIEGEEEVGGEHIEAYVASNHDLHSGVYGGAAPNPLQAIAEILSTLKDREGHIRIPGFYDRVVPPSAKERAAWARLPFDENEYKEKEVGVKELVGEPEIPLFERLWARPTLEVHGIRGGFIGEGAKTVIPARALAKVSMRLVADQKPDEAVAQLKKAIAAACPKGVTAEYKSIHNAPPSLVNPDNRFIQAAAEAMKQVFGKDTVYIRSGGSIPIVAAFDEHLGIPSVMMGFGLPDDNLHAPNEKLYLPNFFRGIEAVARYIEILGA